MPPLHWPTSNDSLSKELAKQQRAVRDSYAAYRAPPLGLQPTGEALAAAAASWAEQMLRGGRNEQLPQDHIPPDTLGAMRMHRDRATNFSAASLPVSVRRLPVFCNSPPFEPRTRSQAIDRLIPRRAHCQTRSAALTCITLWPSSRTRRAM